MVEVDGFVGPDVRSVEVSFELEGETQTLDAVTEQLSPELLRKAGGKEPLGVFIAFLPEGVTSAGDVTATAYDSDGNSLGTTTWFEPGPAAAGAVEPTRLAPLPPSRERGPQGKR